MTKIDFKYYIHWVHMLAWKTLDTGDLSKEERKAIGVFIGNVKKGKYISEKNTLLAKVVRIVDDHAPVKSGDMPKMQDAYTKKQRMAVNKGIRHLHKTIDKNSKVWGYCDKYLYCSTGLRNTRTPSANKLNLGKITLAINAA
jgi:hypothetical protein